MKARPLFTYTSYKAYLIDRIEQNKDLRGYQSQLARAAGCQRSFLSQVLNGKFDLSREHAAELSRFWGLDPLETEYFIGLVDLARAGSGHLRKLTETKLATSRD